MNTTTVTEKHSSQRVQELIAKIREILHAIPVPEEYWPTTLLDTIQSATQTADEEEQMIRVLEDYLLVLRDLEMYVSGDYLQRYCFSTADRARTTPDRYTINTEQTSLRMGTSFTEVLDVMFRLLNQGYRYEGTLSQLWNEALSGNMYLMLYQDSRLNSGEIPMFFRSVPLCTNDQQGMDYRAEADMYWPDAEEMEANTPLDSVFWEAVEILMNRNGKRSAAQILEYHTPKK